MRHVVAGWFWFYLCVEGFLREAYDDRDVQNHVRDFAWFGRPERVNQLSQSCTQRIGKGGYGRCAGPALVRKPEVAVSRWSAQTEWLRESDEDLTKHGDTEDASSRFGPCISNPIADEEES